MKQDSSGNEPVKDGNAKNSQAALPSQTNGTNEGGKNLAVLAVGSGEPNHLAIDFSGAASASFDHGLPTAQDLNSSEPGEKAPFEGVISPEAYPDGPNIEASPWELEAARGNLSNQK